MGFGILRHVYNLLGGEPRLNNRSVGPPNAPLGPVSCAVQYEHAVSLQAFVRALNIDAVAADRRSVREEPSGAIVEAVEALTKLDIFEIRQPWTDPIVEGENSAGIARLERPVLFVKWRGVPSFVDEPSGQAAAIALP